MAGSDRIGLGVGLALAPRTSDVWVSVRLTREERDALQDRAWQDERSLSGFIRMLIRRELSSAR